jgi:hypothetical protein
MHDIVTSDEAVHKISGTRSQIGQHVHKPVADEHKPKRFSVKIVVEQLSEIDDVLQQNHQLPKPVIHTHVPPMHGKQIHGEVVHDEHGQVMADVTILVVHEPKVEVVILTEIDQEV